MILKDEIINRTLVIRQNKAVSTLKGCFVVKNYVAMKDKKKLEVFLKVIQRVFDKTPEMQEVIDAQMLDVPAEECVSPEQEFFYFYISLLLTLQLFVP